MSFERKLTDEQVDAIYELKRQGKSGSETVRICGLGVKDVAPFTTTVATVNYIFRRERERLEDLTESPLADDPDAVDTLRRRIITLAERTIRKLERSHKPIGPELDKLASVVVKLSKLDAPKAPARNGKKPEREKGLLEQLADES